MACRNCADESRQYVNHCTGCVLRRTARLSFGARAAIVCHVATERGIEAGEAFEHQVERERVRLDAAGKL